MSRMPGARRPRAPALALVVAIVGAACGAGAGGGEGEAVIGTGPPRTTSTMPAGSPSSPPAPGLGALVTRRGVVAPVVSRTAGEWTITTPCGRPATVQEGTPVPNAAVVLDAGHGGSDPGAMSPGGLKEATVNLAITEYARAAVESAGYSVLLTRSGDYDMELGPRAQIATGVGARAFVSVHNNAEPDGPWPRPGAETYYQIASADSKRLAGLLYEEALRALSQYQVAWVADLDAGAKYRPGTRGDYYAILRLPATTVTALAELAFISNPPEADLLVRPDVQQALGRAVARGIVRYLSTRDTGSGFTEPYPRPSPPGTGTPGPPLPCTDPTL